MRRCLSSHFFSTDVTLPFTKFIIGGNKVGLLATEIRNTILNFIRGESVSYADYIQAQSITTEALKAMGIDFSEFQAETSEGGSFYQTATDIPIRLLQIVNQMDPGKIST
jgi:hypothetical protein